MVLNTRIPLNPYSAFAPLFLKARDEWNVEDDLLLALKFPFRKREKFHGGAQ